MDSLEGGSHACPLIVMDTFAISLRRRSTVAGVRVPLGNDAVSSAKSIQFDECRDTVCSTTHM
jgi:hypothetical protein